MGFPVGVGNSSCMVLILLTKCSFWLFAISCDLVLTSPPTNSLEGAPEFFQFKIDLTVFQDDFSLPYTGQAF